LGEGASWNATPKFQEVGPYVYEEKRVKYEIQHHHDRDTVSYRQNVTYTFRRDMSVGPETDSFTILNAPLFAVATILHTIPEKDLPLPHRSFIELFMGPLSGDKFLKEHITVRDVVFGVRLNFVYDIALYLVENLLGVYLPPEIQDGKFGPLLNKNGTNSDGLWEIYSGVKDQTKFGRIRTINGVETIGPGTWWKEDRVRCNDFKGGDGIFSPPRMTEKSLVYMYAPEICREVWAPFEKKIKVKGIPGYRFRATKELLASPNEYKDNDCYCDPKPRPPIDPTCAPSGVCRLRTCKTGVPVAFTKPHFLQADPSIFETMEGMHPDRELHESYIDIIPEVGIPLGGSRRVQLSIELQPFPTMGSQFATIPKIFWPYLWVEETAEITDKLADDVKSMYVTPLKLATAARWTLIALGALGIFGGAASLIYFVKFM